MVLIDLSFDELLAETAVSMFEVYAGPIFAVATSGLNMPFSILFLCGGPVMLQDQTRSRG